MEQIFGKQKVTVHKFEHFMIKAISFYFLIPPIYHCELVNKV